jgi:hypothetical protein
MILNIRIYAHSEAGSPNGYALGVPLHYILSGGMTTTDFAVSAVTG